MKSARVVDEKGLLIAEATSLATPKPTASDPTKEEADHYASRIIADANSLFPNSPAPVVTIVAENRTFLLYGPREDGQSIVVEK